MSSATDLAFWEGLDSIVGFIRRNRWRLLGAVIAAAALTLLVFRVDSLKWRYGALLKVKKVVFVPDRENSLALAEIEKGDLLKIQLLIEERDNYRSFMASGPGSGAQRSGEPSFLMIPQFGLELTPDKMKKEFLQALFFAGKAGSDRWKKDMEYVVNIFFRFNSREIVQELLFGWLDKLRGLYQEKHALLENIALLKRKIGILQKQKQGLQVVPNPGLQILLQADSRGERYLDARQQLAANIVLLSDYQNSLILNSRRTGIALELSAALNKISEEYLDKRALPLARIEEFLQREIRAAKNEELRLELSALLTLFGQVRKSVFRVKISPANVPRPISFYLKFLALFCFFAALSILIVVMLERFKTGKIAISGS